MSRLSGDDGKGQNEKQPLAAEVVFTHEIYKKPTDNHAINLSQ
jgi:hypothetical protein